MNSTIGKSAIDSGIFYGANLLVHKVVHSPSPHLKDIGVYFVADFLARTGYGAFFDKYITMFEDKKKINVIAGLLFVAGATALDVLQKEHLTTALKDNLYLAGIGVVANIGVDALIPSIY